MLHKSRGLFFQHRDPCYIAQHKVLTKSPMHRQPSALVNQLETLLLVDRLYMQNRPFVYNQLIAYTHRCVCGIMCRGVDDHCPFTHTGLSRNKERGDAQNGVGKAHKDRDQHI
jgi:hypothetical protein